MKLKKFPILVIVLVIFLVTIFVIGGINEKIQLQLDPLATILAVMGIGYTWWVDQNYQKSSIEGMLLNEMITRQSFKVRKKDSGKEYFCLIRQEDEYGRWITKFYDTNLDNDGTFDYQSENLTPFHNHKLKAKALKNLTTYFEIIEVL